MFLVASCERTDDFSLALVRIPGQGWSIGKFEVTQAQYLAVTGENPSHFKGDALPVECVSWDDAMEFCKRLTQREREAGRLPEGLEYRLPSLEEWGIACRAGTMTRYCSGDTAEDLSRVAWWEENSGGETHPVGTKEANAWGICDMHGNVWEWCLDAGMGADHVSRGGSWNAAAEFCVSGVIGFDYTDSRERYLGFRVVLAPAGK